MTEITKDPFSRPDRYSDPDYEVERSPSFPSFIEKLIISICNSYDADSRETQDEKHRRAREAIRLLFGLKTKHGAPYSYDMPEYFNAYLTVDQKGVYARTENETRRKISRLIVDEYDVRHPDVDIHTRYYNLQKLSESAIHNQRLNSASSETIRKRSNDNSYLDYFFDVALKRVNGEEKEMKEDLDLIASILERWNVKASIDPLKLGLASYWAEIGDEP